MSTLPLFYKLGATFSALKATPPLNNAAGTRNSAGFDRVAAGGIMYNGLTLQASIGVTEGAPDSFTADYSLEHSSDDGVADAYSAYKPDGVTTAALTQRVAINTEASANFSLAAAKRYVRVKEVIAFVNGTVPKLNASSSVILSGGDRV